MNTLTLGHVETVTLPAGRRLLVTGRGSVALTGPVETIEVNGPATVGPFAVERIATLSPGSTRAALVYPGVPVTVRDGEGVMQWGVSAPDFVELTPAQVAAGAVGMLGSNNAGGLVEPDGDAPSLGGAVTLPSMTTAAAAGTGPEREAHRDALGLGPIATMTLPEAQSAVSEGGKSMVLAQWAGRAGVSLSGAGALAELARVPVDASVDTSGRTMRIQIGVDKIGTAGGWGVQLLAVARGASTGSVLWQTYPAGTVLRVESEIRVYVGSSRSDVTVGLQNATAGDSLTISGALAFTPVAANFAADLDLLLLVLPQNGDEVSLRALSVELIAPTLPANRTLGRTIVTAGDSLTYGVGSTANASYPVQLSRRLGRPIVNSGVPSDTAAQIRARVVRATANLALPHVIWAGRNNVGTATYQADVLAEVATMVAALAAAGNTRYLVLGNTPAQTTEMVGTGNRTAITATNAALAAAYGARYVDILTPMLSGAEIAPANYSAATSGEVHFSDAGYGVIAATLQAAIVAAGW